MKVKNLKNQEQDRRLDRIEKHISVINDELGDLKEHLAYLRADVSWLKWFVKLVAGASISGLIVSLLNFLS
mgnify:CR=1 FL=1